MEIFGCLIVAFGAFTAAYFLRKKGRLNSRSFLFWVGFWLIFVVIDTVPSLTGYIRPYFTLGTNMYTLTAISIQVLFVFVFYLFTFLSDINLKLTNIIRLQALNEWKASSQIIEAEGLK